MTIREMMEIIGDSIGHFTVLHRKKDDYSPAPEGRLTSTGKLKCAGCGERFDDGEEVVLHVHVDESDAVPGKPGCSEKRCYHIECCSPELLCELE